MSFPIAPPLRWLFLDLNSYFASVEQQLHPELRGRPVAVVPVMTDSSCAIAASIEAKRCGVKTGTNIGEAKRLCPGITLIQANHDAYVTFHEDILTEIERHFPIHSVCSIDEVALCLDRPRQPEEKALDLARRIKNGLRKNIGEVITCSIGIAPNRYLGKVASDLHKPDGLEVLHLKDLPHRLQHLSLTDLPGIGRNMEPRLKKAGIHRFLDLWQAPPAVLHRVWGGIGGDRFWRQLHGEDLDEAHSTRQSVGHSQVLAPEFRPPAAAANVARRLLLKAASRMRRYGYRAGHLNLAVRAENYRCAEAHRRFALLSDSFALMHHLNDLWRTCLDQLGSCRIKKISLSLSELVAADQPEQLDLFPELGDPIPADKTRRDQLSLIMDDINRHFGRDSIALGFTPNSIRTLSGPKIAFTRIPEQEEFLE